MSSKFNFHYNIKITTGTVHANKFIVLIISQSVLLRMKNVSAISSRENWNTHFVFKFFLNHDAYDIMWKNDEGPDRPQMTIWHMHIACWIIKATDTCSLYVKLVLILAENICCVEYNIKMKWNIYFVKHNYLMFH